MALIVIAVWKGGEALPCDTYELRIAEKIGSGCYIAMQGYYFYRHLTNLGNMQVDMDNYYDSDMSRKLQWMRLSIIALMVMAFFIPIVIFATSKWLLAGSFIVYLGIPYFIDSFCYYARSSTPAKFRSPPVHSSRNSRSLGYGRDSL